MLSSFFIQNLPIHCGSAAPRSAPQCPHGAGPEIHARLGLGAAQQRHTGAVDFDGPRVLKRVLPGVAMAMAALMIINSGF